MGIKLAVKKSVAPACGSFASLAEAIAAPYATTDIYTATVEVQCDAGEFVAIQYDDLGFDAGATYYFSCYNFDNSAAAMTIYTVNNGGSIVDSYVSSDGVVDVGDANLERPYYEEPEATYVVIQNVGGSSCDVFEFTYAEAT